MQVTNFGGRIVSLWVPDKNGNYEDIVLGYEHIERYLDNKGERYLGPVVGRYANRIAEGRFELDGTTYRLPVNNNGQCLHGGLKGLDMVVWQVEQVDENQITLSYSSPDGEDGFPGRLDITMTYELTPDNDLEITYHASTDRSTVVNLSHHSFFNLKGEGKGTIEDHILTIHASRITPVNNVLIPTGEISPVDGTPFDFRTPAPVGLRIDKDDPQLGFGKGYDHNWVIDRKTPRGVEHHATIREPSSGRIIEVWSDQPGIQFYSGNYFDGETPGKYGRPHRSREAFALETQHFPDSPNHAHFPSTRLNPGDAYSQKCIYKFRLDPQ